MRPHAPAEVCCTTRVSHERGQVVRYGLANIPERCLMMACQGLFHVGDVAGQWLSGAAVTEGVVGLGQHTIEWDGLQQSRLACGGDVDGEVTAQADGTGGLFRVAKPPVEDHARGRGTFEFVEHLLAGAVAVDAGDARGALQDAEDTAESGLLAIKRDAALAVESDLADQGGWAISWVKVSGSNAVWLRASPG